MNQTEARAVRRVLRGEGSPEDEAILARVAQEAQEEPYADAMARWDARRRRSGKTRRARKEGQWGVGPSDIGRCRRQVSYRENPPPDYVPEPEDRSVMVFGTMVHEGMTMLYRSLYPWRRTKFKVMIPGFDRPGEIDSYDPIAGGGEVEDWKTGGRWAAGRVGEDGPFPDDVDQAMIYAFGLRAAGEKVEWVRVTYIFRDPVSFESFRFPYDEERAYEAADRLHSVIDMLDAGNDLPRDGLGPSTDGRCRRCPAVRHCWPDDPAGLRSPEGYLLARDDDGITAAAGEYVATRYDREVEARHKFARALLEGVEPGVYNEEWTISWSRPKAPDPVPDWQLRAELLSEHLRRVSDGLEEPLSPDLLPSPMKQLPAKAPSISVKPVRAATKQVSE